MAMEKSEPRRENSDIVKSRGYFPSIGQRERNGTVARFGKGVNEGAKGRRSTLTEFWRRKQPSIRRVSALLCLCHIQ